MVDIAFRICEKMKWFIDLNDMEEVQNVIDKYTQYLMHYYIIIKRIGVLLFVLGIVVFIALWLYDYFILYTYKYVYIIMIMLTITLCMVGITLSMKSNTMLGALDRNALATISRILR